MQTSVLNSKILNIMRRLADLINSKKGFNKARIDEKTIFYFFNKIIEREYGNKGLANLKPEIIKNRKLFVMAKSSVWANELWLNREEIAKEINQEIGAPEINEIKIKNI